MGGFCNVRERLPQIMEPPDLLLCLAGVILGIFFGATRA